MPEEAVSMPIQLVLGTKQQLLCFFLASYFKKIINVRHYVFLSGSQTRVAAISMQVSSHMA